MMYYDTVKEDGDLYLQESRYNPGYEKKTESVFSQCNGYLGVRACPEGDVLEQSRGMFVAGLYSPASNGEVAELVNCPDFVAMRISCGDEVLSLDTCAPQNYRRGLNLSTGELRIDADLTTRGGKRLSLSSRRFASLDNRHLFCHEMRVTAGEDMDISIETGIDGQITNSGLSHFTAVEARVYDRKYLHTISRFDGGKLSVLTACGADKPVSGKVDFGLARRSIRGIYRFQLQKGETLRFSKFSFVDSIPEAPLEDMKKVLGGCLESGYEKQYAVHRARFQAFWDMAGIEIDGATEAENAAIAFAQYHLLGMMPDGKTHASIGAKSLTGQGYKGHVFWDSELFDLPFFVNTFPDAARNLLVFRHRGLEGAREKARDFGYAGAMFPWEVAADGREQTPLYAALDIHTGKATKVWSGLKEHHVTADVAWAVWDYYLATGDAAFLEHYGLEILLEAAVFWNSRAAWNPEKERLEIPDIIGPDEYTEHVDNNAYTNYMAHACVGLACRVIRFMLGQGRLPERFRQYGQMLPDWERFLEKLYLPVPNAEGIIPQDDTFLQKKTLPDLESYKRSSIKQSILLDYSRQEVVDMQVIKQADVVMLLNLFPDLFPPEVVRKNVLFYEQRTLHDSSLSLCAHAIACAAIGESEMAYDFFQKALEIDLDDNPNDTTDGIHAAAMGGIWNCVIQGFAGLRHTQEGVEITPRLPDRWRSIKFRLVSKGVPLQAEVTHTGVTVAALKPDDTVPRIRSAARLQMSQRA